MFLHQAAKGTMQLLQPFHLATLLFLLATNLCLAADDQFTYNGFAGANLTLDGTAAITPKGLLVLTNGTNQMKGHAFHPAPLQLHAAQNGTRVRSFSTTLVFAIYGQYERLSSHGLAFFVSPTKYHSTALPAQFLGLLNAANNGDRRNHMFAVEFDTLFNAEFQDMNNNHVGIDVNSLASRDAANAGYYDDITGQFKNLTLISRKAMQAWVDYDGVATEVKVTIAPLGVAKPKKPLLLATIDLSTILSSPAYVGFSSATGILSSRHYVLGWSFALDREAPALDISALPALPRAGPKPRSKAFEIVLPIASAALVFVVGAAIFIMVRRRLRYAELREDWEVAFGPHRFSYKDLFHATNGFSCKQMLGEGGFGSVYKGVLRKSKTEVAVKRVSHESRQGIKEFVAEVVSIGRLRHRNLVQLLGYCRRKGELFLVYNYMSNGSLDKYLYDQSRAQLNWSQRFHIIKGVTSALLFLHEEWEQVIVHGDVKASNVLLDNEMNVRLGDFGLARLYNHEDDTQTTHIIGTMGYLAPELGHTSKATPASDVFAFGALLLEVTCARRPIEQDEHDNCTVLVEQVLEHWRNGSIISMVDTRLQNEFNPEEVSLVLKLGVLCSHPLPNARPSMLQIMRYLNNDIQLPRLSLTYLNTLILEQMCGDVESEDAISDLSGER